MDEIQKHTYLAGHKKLVDLAVFLLSQIIFEKDQAMVRPFFVQKYNQDPI